MKKMISWLLAAGMLLGSSLMLASCREPEPDPGENKEPDRTVYQIYENFDLFVRADSITHPIDFDHVSGGIEDYELLVPIVIPSDEKLVTVRRGADVTVIAEIEHGPYIGFGWDMELQDGQTRNGLVIGCARDPKTNEPTEEVVGADCITEMRVETGWLDRGWTRWGTRLQFTFATDDRAMPMLQEDYVKVFFSLDWTYDRDRVEIEDNLKDWPQVWFFFKFE